MSNDDWGDFEGDLGREPENWRPTEPDESVYGTVIGLTEVDGQYGTSPQVTVLTPEGREVVIHGFGQVLGSKIYGAGLEIGDRFGVRFLGQKTSKGGSQYRDWKTVVRDRHGRPKVTGGFARNPGDDDEPPAVGVSGAEPPPEPPGDLFISGDDGYDQ